MSRASRASRVKRKIIAAVIAGAFGYSLAAGSAGLVPAAHAETRPAKAKPAKAKPGHANPAGSSSVAGGAQAIDPKKSYGDGEKKFKAGDYAGALVDFQAADSVKATPHAARYIG